MSIPFGLYIHFPYCSHRCPYCDFTLTTRPFDHMVYSQALCNEWTLLKTKAQNFGFPFRPLTSLYLGGGTPSLWDLKALERVLCS